MVQMVESSFFIEDKDPFIRHNQHMYHGLDLSHQSISSHDIDYAG